jgi:hypothetical protein
VGRYLIFWNNKATIEHLFHVVGHAMKNYQAQVA